MQLLNSISTFSTSQNTTNIFRFNGLHHFESFAFKHVRMWTRSGRFLQVYHYFSKFREKIFDKKLFQTFMKIWFDIYFSLIEFEKWFWKYQLDWDEKIRMNNCFGHTLRNLPRRFWEYTFLSSNQKQDKTIIFAFGNVKIFLFELRRWRWDIFQNKFET